MEMKQHFMMFAAYNYWANGQIYDVAAELTDEEFGRDVGAFFGSMMGTLNHLLVADRIWMKRFTSEGEAPRAGASVTVGRWRRAWARRPQRRRRRVRCSAERCVHWGHSTITITVVPGSRFRRARPPG